MVLVDSTMEAVGWGKFIRGLRRIITDLKNGEKRIVCQRRVRFVSGFGGGWGCDV